MKDKQYRLLKSLLYKHPLPIRSITGPQKEDNFIAYSIVKKISNTGWFSNERLLVLDCSTK